MHRKARISTYLPIVAYVWIGGDGRFVRWRLVFRSVETRVPLGKGLLLPNQRDAERPEVQKIVGFRR